MRVLVTGGTGFTGEALLRVLASRGDAVYALHRPDGAKPENLNGLVPLPQDLAAPFDTGLPSEIDAVVHLAQSRRYRDFPEGAADVFEVNANATVRLLDWAREAGARSFVYASSGAVYPPGPEPASEDQPVSPGNFYAASKRSGELACEQFRSELTAHVLRFFFIYGPGQRDMFLPGVLGRIRRDDEVALAGENGIRLNPVYVDDAVRAIVELLARPESMTVNVAGPDVLSMRELSEQAGQLLDRTPHYAMGDPRPDVVASIDVLNAAGLGPRVSFLEGLRHTRSPLRERRRRPPHSPRPYRHRRPRPRPLACRARARPAQRRGRYSARSAGATRRISTSVPASTCRCRSAWRVAPPSCARRSSATTCSTSTTARRLCRCASSGGCSTSFRCCAAAARRLSSPSRGVTCGLSRNVSAAGPRA